MSDKQYIQPSDTFESHRFGFTQVVTSPPGKLVFVSGQVGLDRDLKLIGEGDVAAQAEQALENLRKSLEAAGASPDDVTMLRTYIVDYQVEYAARLAPHFERFFGGRPPASTRVGVQALAAPGLLIEIEAVAVVTA
jgi:enamine deaminase RidA (YjgF/YER057c/UK114 family)